MELPMWFETGSLLVLGAILLGDLLLVAKRPHEPSIKEASFWVAFYVALALVFASVLLGFTDHRFATEFTAGWLTEYSLSVDNLFIFILIMQRLKVPAQYQQRVLMVGILVALVFRAVFILLGAQLIEKFSGVFYLFGAWLLYVAIGQLREHDPEVSDNLLVRMVRKFSRVTDDYHGGHLVARIEGRRHMTPMVVVFITIGSTDLLFALDSIPAIFGLTSSPFIVFTANVFALMGLRQLYFLLGGMLRKLVYLNYGLAAILGFIGVKLILEALASNEVPFINGGEPVAWAPHIPVWLSLAVIVGCIAVATVASLIKTKGAQAVDDDAD
jgi:tellurite resistance protein TerC